MTGLEQYWPINLCSDNQYMIVRLEQCGACGVEDEYAAIVLIWSVLALEVKDDR